MTNNNKEKTSRMQTTRANKPESMEGLLDSLIPLTDEDILTGINRSVAHIKDTMDYALGLRSFLESQQGILGYIHSISHSQEECSENLLIGDPMRHLCLALKARYGWVPALTTEDLQAAAAQAAELLAQPALRAKVVSAPVMNLILENEYLDAPERDRMLPMMLTIWIAFTRAYSAPVFIGDPEIQPEHSAAAVRALTPAEYTQTMAAALHRSSPELHVRIVKDLEVELRGSEGDLVPYYLQSMYEEYMRNKCTQDEHIASCVSSILEDAHMGGSAPIDRSRIVPVLKNTSCLRRNEQSTPSEADAPEEYAHQPFSGDLVIVYAVDGVRTLRYVTQKDLPGLNLSVEALHNMAFDNAKRLLPGVNVQEDNGIYQVLCDGNFDASLILFDEFWEMMAHFNLRGEIVVAVPARDSCFVTGSECSKSIQRLAGLAQHTCASSLYPVSAQLFMRRHGKCVPYVAASSPT